MIENSFSEDLEVIKQITRLQGMSKPELHATWDKFFDHPPEICNTVLHPTIRSARERDVQRIILLVHQNLIARNYSEFSII